VKNLQAFSTRSVTKTKPQASHPSTMLTSEMVPSHSSPCPAIDHEVLHSHDLVITLQTLSNGNKTSRKSVHGELHTVLHAQNLVYSSQQHDNFTVSSQRSMRLQIAYAKPRLCPAWEANIQRSEVASSDAAICLPLTPHHLSSTLPAAGLRPSSCLKTL